MSNPNHGRRKVRAEIKKCLEEAAAINGSALPAKINVKDDKRQHPQPGTMVTRLAIMPENTDIQQAYIGDEGEINHTVIIEWSVFASEGIETGSVRTDAYEDGLTEIAAALTADPGFNGTCAFSRPARLEEIDEDYGRSGALSAGFIFMQILLDSASVLA